ncbi:MAG TPA: VWA domain-containing protein [Blastocatellia bacterium]|nr:VWA domain-containing protein [Blastocatellia bacterium]
MKKLSAWLLVACLIVPALAVAQNPANNQPANQDQPLRLRTDEVIVDAVVLDKKNRSAKDLTADDFEIYEDGVKQKVLSFRFESNSAATETGTSGAGTSSASRTFNLVSLVFDAQTTRDGALRARKAALDFIETGMQPNDYVAVFGIDLGLLMLAPYTNDKQTLREAVDAFTSRESKKYLAVAAAVRSRLESLVEPLSDSLKVSLADQGVDIDSIAPVSSLDTRSGTSSIDPFKVLLSAINLSGLRTLRTFERYEREFQGWRSVAALLAIINGQKSVRAARKTMFYFSEGFAVTPAVEEQFKSVISAANTGGVTIYSMDIAGLRIENPNAQAALEHDAIGQGRMRNANPELVQNGVSALGRTEEAARINTLTVLDELSEDTGGSAVKNTNDVTEGLRRILDELGNHYVLTYLPSNANYDGKFRRITVKLVRQGDYKVRARHGYYGLRTLDDAPVLAHEVPLFERLNATSPVRDFPLYAQALHFRGTGSARQVAVYVEFPVAALQFDVNDKAKIFSSRFALLALVKNSDNEIVRKLGQEFTLRGPLTQLEEIKKRPQMYNRLLLLAPGKYTLEAVAQDTASGKASAVRVPFEVPAAAEQEMRLSSVVLSQGVNPLTEEQKKQGARHPLYLEGQAYFVPNLKQTFSQSKDKNLLIHFNVYLPANAAAKVNATLTFLTKGQIFTEAEGTLPDADGTGRIAYATSFGTDNFPPGDYQLRVTVKDGARRVSSTTAFTIEP